MSNKTNILASLNDSSAFILTIITAIFLLANFIIYYFMYNSQKNHEKFIKDYSEAEAPLFIANIANRARSSSSRIFFFQARIYNQGRSNSSLSPIQQAYLYKNEEDLKPSIIPVLILPGDYPMEKLVTIKQLEFLDRHSNQSIQPHEIYIVSGAIGMIWVGVLFNPILSRSEFANIMLNPVRGQGSMIKLRHGVDLLSPI